MSLTEDWKAGNLDKEFYWVKVKCGIITPMQYYTLEDENGKIIKTFGKCGDYEVVEVLDICDYDELQELKIKKELAVNTADSYARENEKLRSILKECKDFLYMYPTPEIDYKDLYNKVIDILGE